MTKIYHTKMADALPSKKRVAEEKARLEKAGIKYILSCWIDMLGLPKTKPIPFAEFEALCAGKGPQFAVHSVSFVPELGPNDSDQIPVPDLDSLVICPWDKPAYGFFLTCGGRMNLIIYALDRHSKELFKMLMMLVIKLSVVLSQNLLQCVMRMVSQSRRLMMTHFQVKALDQEGRPLDMMLSTQLTRWSF